MRKNKHAEVGVPLGKPTKANHITRDVDVSRDDIARLAYSYWEARNRQQGFAEEDWIRAERDLKDKPELAIAKSA